MGAIIGAGAVVTKNVPPYSVVAGNLARVIKHRFDTATIERLLASRWWELPDGDLAKLGDWVPEPRAFLDRMDAMKGGGTKLIGQSSERTRFQLRTGCYPLCTKAPQNDCWSNSGMGT